MQLVHADGPVLEQILDASYSLWGEGLTRRGYGQYNAAQLRTAWGQRNLARLALVENGRLLASAKRYDLAARTGSRTIRVLGIGAVFTPPDLRGRGLARNLIDLMISDAARDGIHAALLFSEIGPAYYARLGFTEIPIETVTLDMAVSPVDVARGRREGAPAVPVRSGDDRDIEHIAGIARRVSDRFPFALDRSAEFIQFGVTRKRLLAGFTRGGSRRVEFLVVEEGGRPAAYVVTTASPFGRTLEECGDLDPSGARVGAILQSLRIASHDRAATLKAWLPPALLPPQLSILGREPARDVMMTRGIDPSPAAEDVLYWHGDLF
jgi:predicted N-acetyltransferase YhbS